ncbi:unnamed protein product, partial [Heterosigma akashiwo]
MPLLWQRPMRLRPRKLLCAAGYGPRAARGTGLQQQVRSWRLSNTPGGATGTLE